MHSPSAGSFKRVFLCSLMEAGRKSNKTSSLNTLKFLKLNWISMIAPRFVRKKLKNMCHLYLKPFYHNIGDITIENEVFSHWLGLPSTVCNWKSMDIGAWKSYKKRIEFQ